MQTSHLPKMLINPIFRCLHPHLQSLCTKLRYFSNQPKMMSDKIVWVDLEMTGLDIEKDSILEIACCITDFGLKDVIQGPNIAIKTSEEKLQAMNPWCIDQHGKSRLTERCRESSITLLDAEEAVLNFLKDHVEEGVAPLAGNTIYMDRLFLMREMPRFNKYMHYRIIDVSSLRELCKRWAPGVSKSAPTKKRTHRALDDIYESINELKYFGVEIFQLPE